MSVRVGSFLRCKVFPACFIAFYTSWRLSDEDRLNELLAIRGIRIDAPDRGVRAKSRSAPGRAKDHAVSPR